MPGFFVLLPPLMEVTMLTNLWEPYIARYP